jgi:hypothetical protein
MSQENVELARRAVDDWNRGEFIGAKLRLYYHPDVEWLPLRAETEGAFHGIEGMERFWADTQEVFEKFELHYELLDLGERVLAWGEIHLRARGSGIETDIPFGGLVEFLDGKIVRWEDFGSKDKALKAVGLEG